MKILYVTRAFPPRVGGMETAAYELYRSLSEVMDVRLVAYGGPNKYLPVVYPWLFIRALWAGLTFRPQAIYVQDGVLSLLGLMLKWIFRKPCVMSVHGLDVTYKSPMYRRLIKFTFPRIDRIVVGSGQTGREVKARFPYLEIARVTYGVRDGFYQDKSAADTRRTLAKSLGLDGKLIAKKKLIVTTGRLVERKGVAWFIDNALPMLVKKHSEVLYLVAGNGPDREGIERLVKKHALEEHVRLLGYISDEARNLLYNAADIFLMPNIPVPGDMEGFGLVALEAASCGTPVFVSGIEGIVDAVADGKTGRLLKARDTDDYVKALSTELSKSAFKRQKVRSYVLENYSWEKDAAGYLEIFKELVG